MTLRIKDWNKFQHFKDRRPPWIKLYRDILEDPDWHNLDGDTAKTLVALWLIASEDKDQEGALPDARHLAFRLRTTEAKINQQLTKLSHWLYQDDINLISEGYHSDIPETEKRQIRDRGESDKRQRTDSTISLLDQYGITGQLATDFIAHRKAKKAVINQTILDGLVREAIKAKITVAQAIRISIERNWQGFNADWLNDKKPQAEVVHFDQWLGDNVYEGEEGWTGGLL